MSSVPWDTASSLYPSLSLDDQAARIQFYIRNQPTLQSYLAASPETYSPLPVHPQWLFNKEPQIIEREIGVQQLRQALDRRDGATDRNPIPMAQGVSLQTPSNESLNQLKGTGYREDDIDQFYRPTQGSSRLPPHINYVQLAQSLQEGIQVPRRGRSPI